MGKWFRGGSPAPLDREFPIPVREHIPYRQDNEVAQSLGAVVLLSGTEGRDLAVAGAVPVFEDRDMDMILPASVSADPVDYNSYWCAPSCSVIPRYADGTNLCVVPGSPNTEKPGSHKALLWKPGSKHLFGKPIHQGV